MPTASRNERRKRRLKRNNSLLRRDLGKSQRSMNLGLSTLFMVLAQQGGEITLSKGTVKSVTNDLAKLAYSIDKGAEEGEFVVRLIVQTEMPTVTDNSQQLAHDDQITDQGVVGGTAAPVVDAHLGAVGGE